MPSDLEDKKGHPRIDIISVRGFFFALGPEYIFYLGKEAKNEKKVYDFCECYFSDSTMFGSGGR